MIYFNLFWTFFKIGAFTFGGGYAMLPLVQSEVTAKGWMTTREIVDFIAVSESTPGPFAVNISTYVGNQVGGMLGGLLATLGVVLPSFFIILLIAGCYHKFQKNKYLAGVMSGLKPAVIGLISTAILSVAGSVFFPDGDKAHLLSPSLPLLLSLGIFGVALYLSHKKLHPILLILLAAVTGILAGYLGLLS